MPSATYKTGSGAVLTDASFEQLLWYFRMQRADDRERLEKVNLHHLGIIPDGLSFVTGPERFTPNHQFIGMVMSQNRQSMSEASASFTQDVNDGTTKEMTATETMARVNSMNAMVGGMLGLAYTYQGFQVSRDLPPVLPEGFARKGREEVPGSVHFSRCAERES
jgi:hypothetical protein